jgi:hypothetical protein
MGFLSLTIFFLNGVMQGCYNEDQSSPEPMISISEIIVRENRRGNQKRTIQRNQQNRAHRTTKNKAKTQHNNTLETTTRKQAQTT